MNVLKILSKYILNTMFIYYIGNIMIGNIKSFNRNNDKIINTLRKDKIDENNKDDKMISNDIKINTEKILNSKFIDNYFIIIGINKDEKTVDLIITNNSKNEIIYKYKLTENFYNIKKLENMFNEINSRVLLENLVYVKNPLRIEKV